MINTGPKFENMRGKLCVCVCVWCDVWRVESLMCVCSVFAICVCVCGGAVIVCILWYVLVVFVLLCLWCGCVLVFIRVVCFVCGLCCEVCVYGVCLLCV